MRRITHITAIASLMLAFAASVARCDDVKPVNGKKQKPLAWAKKPVKDWPQLVLTNAASFKGHSSLEGASAFLLRTSTNDVLLVTARHLIGADGGVEPPIALDDFDKALAKWDAFPRTKPDKRVAASGLALSPMAGARHDWLLLYVKNPKGDLPVMPLRARTKRAEIGDAAYLIGVPYSDQKSSQNVYKGKVTGRPGRNYFQFEFEPPVKLAGFSGAPVVDADGYLLGMMTTSPESKRKDGLQTTCWCQDIAMGYSLWKKQGKPQTEEPTHAVNLALPEGWKEKSSSAKNVVISAEYPKLDASIQLQAFPTENFKDVMDLKAWATRNKSVKLGDALEDRRETELVSIKMGGKEAFEYEVSGKIAGSEIRYRMILFERNGQYCNLLCWAPGENWTQVQPRFNEVFKAIK